MCTVASAAVTSSTAPAPAPWCWGGRPPGGWTPNYALATQVEFTDPDIVAEYVYYPSPKGHGRVRGYLVRPAKASGKVPAVVVVHENRGLNPYIEDVARRLAKAGYLALAPDGLTAMGGYPGNDDKGRELQQQVDPEKLMNDFFAAVETLMGHEFSTGKVGITGFCYGGGVANAAAVAYPELAAAVPFYGRQPRAEEVAAIKAPLPTKRRSRRPARPMRCIAMPAPTMASTTIPPRAMTKPPRAWPGTAPWAGSAAISPRHPDGDP